MQKNRPVKGLFSLRIRSKDLTGASQPLVLSLLPYPSSIFLPILAVLNGLSWMPLRKLYQSNQLVIFVLFLLVVVFCWAVMMEMNYV